MLVAKLVEFGVVTHGRIGICAMGKLSCLSQSCFVLAKHAFQRVSHLAPSQTTNRDFSVALLGNFSISPTLKVQYLSGTRTHFVLR
jgi:hypothetical protein